MQDSNSPTPLPKVSKRYITEATLGQGGMGIIYRAYDNITKRHVAVKTISGAVEAGALELFEREWTVLARLSHPNIVDILDTGEYVDETGQRKPYFVMPLLPGKTLDEIIKRESQRLTVERVIEIMCQACRGLQAAHDQNLVHRDLKPSNIFVLDDDTAKIIDFGVAHLADSRTVTGMKGTLQYMSPEQTDMSSPVSARSDIFSLAIVCYEALTGRKPFARRTEAETIEAIRTHIPPPASEINGAVNNLVARTVHKAMAKQPWHRFPTAKEFSDTLLRAMRNEPIERFDRAKIQPRIERVKKAYSEGDNQFAMEILTELESEGHIDPDMPVLRMQIEQSVRQRTIRQLLESARTRMEGDEHPLALQKLGEVLALDPNNLDALTLRAHIEKQRSEKQLEQWFRLVEEHNDNQLFSQARQGLQEILKIDSSNTRARTMLAEIDQTEQQANRLREEKQSLYEGALASYRNGEISTALSKLERGLDISRRPNARAMTTELDAQYQSFYNQVRSERDNARNAYAEGRKLLDDKNTVRTLEICEEYLQKHPSDPMFQALKLEAEEMQRQDQSAAIAEVNRRADSEPDLDKKFNIIKEACDRFPQEAHFKSSLKLIRDRRDLVNSIVTRAKQYEERGQFVESTNQWDILRNIYPVYPGLEFEVERLTRRREENAHAEAKAHWMERIDNHFANGEYAKAHGVIQEAQADFPNDKELEGLGSLAEQGIRRSAEANVLLAQGRELCSQHDYAGGLDALRKAERLDPRNSATRATLLTCLVEHARELITKDWHAAEPLVQEASVLNSEDPVVRSLNSLLASNKRQESINGILVEARGLQASDDLAGAIKKVEDGLAEFPNEVRLAQLQNTLRAAATAAKTDHSANFSKPEIGAHAEKPVEVAKAVGAGNERIQSATPLGFASTSFQPIQSKATALDDSPTRLQTDLPAAKLPPASVRPPGPTGVKPPLAQTLLGFGDRFLKGKPTWLLAFAAAVVLILGALIYSVVFKRSSGAAVTDSKKAAGNSGSTVNPASAGIKVSLSANHPGVTFKVDGAMVPASVTLKPGEHTGEADLVGFTPDTHSFVVNDSGSPVNVAFTLNPALPELLFSSGLEHGSAILDDAPPIDLQEGAFNKGDIAMGEHRLRILDGRSEVLSFSFKAEPQQVIKLTAPISSRGGSGILISSLGGAAQVYGTPGLKGSVGGATPQSIAGEGLSVPAANPPQHVTVIDGAKTRDFSPDPASRPILNVILTGGVERVPISITANVPDGTVSIDGVQLKRKMANGSRFLSLGPGAYSVTVLHDGYQPVAAQRLVIKPGDELKRMTFQLAPIVHLASMDLAGAPADAAVFLDDIRAGTVNSSGSFSKEISPGSHQIGVRKAGLEEFKATHDFKAGETFRLTAAMHPLGVTLTLHVTPANAKVTLRHDTDIYPAQNGQSATFPPGVYTVTAAADDSKTRTETIQLEAGKPMTLDWVLPTITQKPVESGPVIPFANSKQWQLDNGWLIHKGNGLSFFNGSSGLHSIDILRRKNRVGLAKRVVFYADFASKGNYTRYTLDGKTLRKTVYVDNVPSTEVGLAFGQDVGETIRMIIELSPESFTIKNRSGLVVDSIKKPNIGKFAFVDDVTLNVNP